MTRLRDLVRREPRRGLVLPSWLERLVSAGIVTADPQLARQQKSANVAAFAMAVDAAGHFVINALYDFGGLLLVNVYNLLVVLAALTIPLLHRFGRHAAAYALIVIVLTGTVFVVLALGIASDLHLYLTLAGAMIFLFGVHEWRMITLFLAVFLAMLLGLLNFGPVAGFVLPEDGDLRAMLSSQALINALIINAAMIFYATTGWRNAEIDLQQENERSEALITTLMPGSIAARLKSGAEKRIADRIENLSVLFADLVDFTGAAHDLPPENVVDYLDSLVRRFDALAETYGVEKIKTIGDSYMAAAGFGDAPTGAVAIGRYALALLEEIAAAPALGTRKLSIRIGIHCGPATAGVIGDTRFSYDVWGNAVNTASRMESHGDPGRIHVSDAFRALAGDAFSYEERGTTELKGIGETKTYFLLGSK